MGTPNWAKLVEQGRAKGIGQPWSDKELCARYVLGIPAEYVRQGVLTEQAYKQALAKTEDKERRTGEKSPFRMTKNELLKKAQELKLNIVGDIPRHELVRLVTKALK